MLKDFHLSLLNKFQKQFNLSNYSILLISYAEGILLGIKNLLCIIFLVK